MKVDLLQKIDYFEDAIKKHVEACLPIKYRNVNVQNVSNMIYANVKGYTFRILYYPTGTSAADRPKKLPDGVLEKLKKRIRNKLNGKFYNETIYDRLTAQNIEITYFHLHSMKLTKLHQKQISSHVTRNEVKDFFNY